MWLSPDTMRRVALWREAASIRAGALFRRVAVIRTKPREARRALAIEDLAYHARVDRERMAARPARAATVTYGIGERALTPAAMRLIIKRTALAAADQGLVDLMGADLDHAIDHYRLRRVAAAAEAIAHRYQRPGDDVRVDVLLMAPGCWPRRITNAWQPAS